MDAATMAATTAATTANQASGYRLKFNREEFLKLVEIAKPRIIYRRGKNHIFAFDGFVMYSQRCSDEDFTAPIIPAIEFSNYSWET
jgi:hypothetical protein